MVIKILYLLLVLCTAALVAVGVGIVLRVRRHLKQKHVDGHAASEPEEAQDSEVKDRSS